MGTKRMALGKGLGALIPELDQEEAKNLLYCGIEEIIPNWSQPRKYFDEAKLQELAASIKEKGILEPLIVRRVDQGYELIVGERRWRAAQKAGLKEVPVLVKEIDGREVLELSLIENLQREDLNPIEREAEAYKRLGEDSGLSQEELGARLGKDRTTITNAPSGCSSSLGSERTTHPESHHFRTCPGYPQPRNQGETEGALCPDRPEVPFRERGRSFSKTMVGEAEEESDPGEGQRGLRESAQ